MSATAHRELEFMQGDAQEARIRLSLMPLRPADGCACLADAKNKRFWRGVPPYAEWVESAAVHGRALLDLGEVTFAEAAILASWRDDAELAGWWHDLCMRMRLIAQGPMTHRDATKAGLRHWHSQLASGVECGRCIRALRRLEGFSHDAMRSMLDMAQTLGGSGLPSERLPKARLSDRADAWRHYVHRRLVPAMEWELAHKVMRVLRWQLPRNDPKVSALISWMAEEMRKEAAREAAAKNSNVRPWQWRNRP